MRWLVILDPIKELVSATDTSLAIINQAHSVGIDVETATIQQLFFENVASVKAQATDGSKQSRTLTDYDIIFMRKEPPYDIPFHYATHLLSLTDTLVVNNPRALRDLNEKLVGLPFVRYMPPTLVSSDLTIIDEFLLRYNGGIIKALDSFQGISVVKIAHGDHEKINTYTNNGIQPVMVQQFMNEVYAGDKRVILLGSKVLGAVVRKPTSGYHANFANSETLCLGLTEKEQEVVDTVGPWLLSQGVHFAGLDFIGEKLTEINITCPTGIMQIAEIENRNLAKEMVDYFVDLIKNNNGK